MPAAPDTAPQVLPEVVYEASRAGDEGLRCWPRILREAWAARGLTWRLFVRDLSARYRQSALGYVWALFPGVATTALFVYLKDESFLKIRDPGVPYPAYVLFGVTVWQVFAGGLTAATESLSGAGPLVAKVNFPRESLLFAAFGRVLFDALLRVVLLAGVFAWFGLVPSWPVVFLPLVLLPLVLLALGLGFFTSLAQVLFRDTVHALTLVLGLSFFLVPVVYPPPRHWPKVLVNDLNPVSVLVTAAHDLVVRGELTRPASFAAACLAAALVFFAGWRVFRLAQPIIAERV